jgi:hypothetical protein
VEGREVFGHGIQSDDDGEAKQPLAAKAGAKVRPQKKEGIASLLFLLQTRAHYCTTSSL